MNKSTVNLVIGGLILLAVLVVGGGIFLTANDKSLPGELIAIGSAAAGAVAGILSRTGHGDVQEVVGPDGGPVLVDEAGHADTNLVVAICLVAIAVTIVLWGLGYFPLDGR